MTESTQGGSPDKTKVPFGAWKTFKTFVESEMKAKHVPAKIDTSVLSGKSGTDVRGLRDGMRYWGLAVGDSLETTERLHRVVAAFGTEQWKPMVAELLSSYNPIVAGLDLTKATQKELDDAFKAASGFSGSTLKKAVRLYVAMATEAGLKLSPFFKSLRGLSDGAEPSQQTAAPSTNGTSAKPKAKKRAKSGSTSTDGSEMTTPDGVDAILLMPGRDFKAWIPKDLTEQEFNFGVRYLCEYLNLTRKWTLKVPTAPKVGG